MVYDITTYLWYSEKYILYNLLLIFEVSYNI